MREWTIIVASAGAIAVAAGSFPLLGGYAARGTHGELVSASGKTRCETATTNNADLYLRLPVMARGIVQQSSRAIRGQCETGRHLARRYADLRG
jgi:hypothetical protein